MQKITVVSAFAVLGVLAGAVVAMQQGGSDRLPACEWCGAQDAPSELTAGMHIADTHDAGERMILRGVVYEKDGHTPAEGVLVYAYHTDINGLYQPGDNPTGNERRHGALRGWLRTGVDGRYKIHTIKPEPYPSRREAAHVHLTLTPRGGREGWLESTLFEGDPLIAKQVLERDARDGRFGEVVSLARNEDGVLVGERDLKLPGNR